MELNQFIDFDAMLDHLIKENRAELIEYQYEANWYADLLRFMDFEKEHYTLEVEECSYDGKEIEWYYTQSLNNANESNAHSDTIAYSIKFSTILNEFTDCEYQGA